MINITKEFQSCGNLQFFVSFRGRGNGRELHAIVEIVATMKLDNLLICLIHEVIQC